MLYFQPTLVRSLFSCAATLHIGLCFSIYFFYIYFYDHKMYKKLIIYKLIYKFDLFVCLESFIVHKILGFTHKLNQRN